MSSGSDKVDALIMGSHEHIVSVLDKKMGKHGFENEGHRKDWIEINAGYAGPIIRSMGDGVTNERVDAVLNDLVKGRAIELLRKVKPENVTFFGKAAEIAQEVGHPAVLAACLAFGVAANFAWNHSSSMGMASAVQVPVERLFSVPDNPENGRPAVSIRVKSQLDDDGFTFK